MPEFEVNGHTYEVDEDGFLQNPEVWDRNVATDFAKAEDINLLTDEHWKVIHYLRDYYLKFGVAPMVRKVCKE